MGDKSTRSPLNFSSAPYPRSRRHGRCGGSQARLLLVRLRFLRVGGSPYTYARSRGPTGLLLLLLLVLPTLPPSAPVLVLLSLPADLGAERSIARSRQEGRIHGGEIEVRQPLRGGRRRRGQPFRGKP